MKNENLIENIFTNISPKIDSFEASLKSLEAETFTLADFLDNTSDTIRTLEKSLHGSKTNFVFKKKICTENQSVEKSPEERHLKDPLLEIKSYHTETWWLLSWEPDEISKNYRLFLTSEEKEFCWSEFYRDFEAYAEAGGKLIEFKSSVEFKKPLIEAKLELRLRFSQHIIPFMNSFEKELRKYRRSLSNNADPFK